MLADGTRNSGIECRIFIWLGISATVAETSQARCNKQILSSLHFKYTHKSTIFYIRTSTIVFFTVVVNNNVEFEDFSVSSYKMWHLIFLFSMN